MSFDALKEQVSNLDDASLRKLIAYAASVQRRREGFSIDDLTKALDDPDPKRWISLEEAERRWDRVREEPDQ